VAKSVQLTITGKSSTNGHDEWKSYLARPTGRIAEFAKGLCLTGLAILLGCGLVFTHSLTVQENGRHNPVLLAIFALLGGWVCSLLRHAKRLRRVFVPRKVLKDSRPPILLLRAFQDDFRDLTGFSTSGNILTYQQTQSKTFEEFLYELFSRCGPVVAIGRPGETTPPLGAHRFWIDDENWKNVVTELLSVCQRIVMIIGELPPANRYYPEDGLSWELRRLFELPDYQKIIFVMPPVDEDTARRRWDRFSRASRGSLPIYQGGEIAANFDEDGQCRVARIGKTGWFSKAYRRDFYAYSTTILTKPLDSGRTSAKFTGTMPQLVLIVVAGFVLIGFTIAGRVPLRLPNDTELLSMLINFVVGIPACLVAGRILRKDFGTAALVGINLLTIPLFSVAVYVPIAQFSLAGGSLALVLTSLGLTSLLFDLNFPKLIVFLLVLAGASQLATLLAKWLVSMVL